MLCIGRSTHISRALFQSNFTAIVVCDRELYIHIDHHLIRNSTIKKTAPEVGAE